MLQSLHIKDFILIEKLELDFSEGFCVITGDTGAGKSIVLDSILFCLAGKFSGNPVRPGVDSCTVTLVFSVCNNIEQYLKELEIEFDDKIILKRTQNQAGRKKFFINDQIVTAKAMQGLFDYLLELHGQHNHTLLINSSKHLEILDEYDRCLSLRKEVALCYQNWQELEQKIEEFVKEKDNIENEIDYLSHVCAELQKAQIIVGEEQELADLKIKLKNRDKKISLIESVIAEIESSSIEQIIARSQRTIGNIDNIESLEQVNTDLELVYDKIEDMKSTLGHIFERIA